MHSRTSRVLLCSFVAAFTAVDSVSAEEKTSWLSNPFTISSGLENVPVQGGGLSVEGVMLVTPSRFSYNRASGRTHWGVGYQPEFEFRSGTGLLSSFNQSADASYGHLFSRRTKLDLGHSFVNSSDPARLFTENIFVMPRDGFRENATALTLSHELAARTTLNLRFDNTFTRMSAGGDSPSTVLNQSGVAGTIGISQHLSPRHKITLSYSLLKFRPYSFDSTLDAGQFAANIPMIKAGIALFGASLAASVSRSSPNPTGIASTNLQSGLSTSTPSDASQASSVLHTSTSITSAGQSADISTAPVSTAGAAKVAVTVPPATASATVVVPPANVPLVPVVTAPSINPTLPLVGVVAPPSTSTSSSKPCESKKKDDCKKSDEKETSKSGGTINSNTASTLVNSAASTSTASTTSTTSSTSTTSNTSSAAPASPSSAPNTSVSPTGNSVASANSTVSSQSASSTAPQNLQLFGDPFHVLSATYSFTKGPGLLIEVSGGAMRDRDMSYLMGFQVERRVDRLWFAGGFQRFLSFYGMAPFQGGQPTGSITLPSGVTSRSVFSALTGRVGGKLNRRTDLEMSFSHSKSTANFVVHDVHSIIGRARINYWLNERLTLFADFESFRESGTAVQATLFSRQRYFGGLLVRLLTSPGPRQRLEK